MYFQVIMPMRLDVNCAEKQRLIAEAASAYGLTPRFPPKASAAIAFNLKTAIADLSQSAFVLADLSFERPSCYYELGLAEALGKRVFIVAMQGTTIHQTAARQAINFYRNLNEFKKVIHRILRSVHLIGEKQV